MTVNRSLFNNIAPQLGNHINEVDNMLQLLSLFHEAKEKQYQRSFAKRGEAGVWYNLMRQLDRVDGIAQEALTAGEYSAGLVDTLVDVTLYAVKWLAVIQVLRPEDFQKWLREAYCPYMGVEYDDVMLWFNGQEQNHDDNVDAYALAFGGVDWAKGDSVTGTIARYVNEDAFGKPVTYNPEDIV